MNSKVHHGANLGTTPQVQLDYDKFAKLAGMTDGSARVTWGRIRRKLTAASSGEETPGSAKAATGTPKPKGRKGGRKRKVEYVGNGEGESVAELRAPESPTDMLLELRKKAKKKSQGGASAVGNGSNGGQVETEGGASAASNGDGGRVLAEDGVPIKGEDGVTIKSENRFE